MNRLAEPLDVSAQAPGDGVALESSPPRSGLPWWRYGLLWMVLAGPLIVIVASMITLWLALRTPDPVLPIGQGVIGRTQSSSDGAQLAPAPQQALVPALKARNHAATGAAPERP